MSETPTAERITQLGTAFFASKTLLSAVELGLFTELAKEPLEAAALRERLGLHPRGARDFFDALVALGLLERHDGRYRNSPEADRFLDLAKPSYLGGLLEMANGLLYPSWAGLTEALRTGRPQFRGPGVPGLSGVPDSLGTGGVPGEPAPSGAPGHLGPAAAPRRPGALGEGDDLFAAMYPDPARLREFLQGMTGRTLPTAQALAQRFPWGRYRTFVDVGTAQGALPAQIALAHPHLTGGGFDLPPVGPHFAEYVAGFGLAERLRFYPGDFFRDPLPRADVLVMGRVLHDWDLAQKRLLLGKAYAALPEGGALIVYEMLIDDQRRAKAAGLLMSLNMLVMSTGGFDYTGADCRGWMREAGFRESYVEHLVGPDSMVVGLK